MSFVIVISINPHSNHKIVSSIITFERKYSLISGNKDITLKKADSY